jgi:histidyl-tRNA synthetase
MPGKISVVKGFRDVLPREAAARRRILAAGIAVLERYGFGEIELPLLERGELFSRSVGASTDIVEKEMYAFEDRDGELVALRPEGTASVVRAYLESGMVRAQPVARLYYHGPMFRRERPQKGRFRQFSQIGAELLGRDDPQADAEMLCLVADLCEATGLGDVRIEVNSLGDSGCRPGYRKALADFGHAHAASLCADCRARLDRNPLRILDCKNDRCREVTADAPLMQDYLCGDCTDHHARVVAAASGAGVVLHSNPRMVRGLDYYCRTAFEVTAAGLGAQSAVGGGGRYDGLVAELGGPQVAGIGFAFGIERMEMVARAAGGASDGTTGPEFYVAPVDRAGEVVAVTVARRLRGAGRVVELGPSDRKLKAQLKLADRTGARWAVIVGKQEIGTGRAMVRDLEARKDYTEGVDLGASGAEIVATIERMAQVEA